MSGIGLSTSELYSGDKQRGLRANGFEKFSVSQYSLVPRLSRIVFSRLVTDSSLIATMTKDANTKENRLHDTFQLHDVYTVVQSIGANQPGFTAHRNDVARSQSPTQTPKILSSYVTAKRIDRVETVYLPCM
ncbi:hypothetical protein HN011_010588 [Eciton burchellii]|nr:hypothetical protein HN011_010588 [Eciton burchellii]